MICIGRDADTGLVRGDAYTLGRFVGRHAHPLRRLVDGYARPRRGFLDRHRRRRDRRNGRLHNRRRRFGWDCLRRRRARQRLGRQARARRRAFGGCSGRCRRVGGSDDRAAVEVGSGIAGHPPARIFARRDREIVGCERRQAGGRPRLRDAITDRRDQMRIREFVLGVVDARIGIMRIAGAARLIRIGPAALRRIAGNVADVLPAGIDLLLRYGQEGGGTAAPPALQPRQVAVDDLREKRPHARRKLAGHVQRLEPVLDLRPIDLSRRGGGTRLAVGQMIHLAGAPLRVDLPRRPVLAC